VSVRRFDWTGKIERLEQLRAQGLSFADIATLLGTNIGTVKRRWSCLQGVPARERVGGWKPSSDLIRIRQACAAAFGLTEAQLMSRSRVRTFSHPRQVACYVLRKARPKLSYPCIAITIGGRDHSTIIHAVRQVEMRMLDDADLAGKVTALIAMFARRADVRQHDAHVDMFREYQRKAFEREAAEREAARLQAERDEAARLASDDEFVASMNPARRFCDQCDRSVSGAEAARCSQRLCGLKPRVAA